MLPWLQLLTVFVSKYPFFFTLQEHSKIVLKLIDIFEKYGKNSFLLSCTSDTDASFVRSKEDRDTFECHVWLMASFQQFVLACYQHQQQTQQIIQSRTSSTLSATINGSSTRDLLSQDHETDLSDLFWVQRVMDFCIHRINHSSDSVTMKALLTMQSIVEVPSFLVIMLYTLSKLIISMKLELIPTDYFGEIQNQLWALPCFKKTEAPACWHAMSPPPLPQSNNW